MGKVCYNFSTSYLFKSVFPILFLAFLAFFLSFRGFSLVLPPTGAGVDNKSEQTNIVFHLIPLCCFAGPPHHSMYISLLY